jgi:large subunit ribosomal protein L23
MATEKKVAAKEEKAVAPKAKKAAPKAKKVAAVKDAPVKKGSVKYFDSIVRPIITEKTMSLIQEQNKVTVEVAEKADRDAVKIAFEAVFGVKVAHVNIVNVRSKSTRRGGRYEGSVPGFKKAIVTLAEGQALDLFKE